MIELLQAACNEDAAALAAVHVDRTATYQDLLDSSLRVAGELTARGITRFGVVCPDTTLVIPLLAGASAIGAETCLYPATATPEAVLECAARFEHDVVVSLRSDLGDSLSVIHPEELTGGRPLAVADLDVPAQRPHLVLTTGTTGHQRAVRHDWNRLLVATEGIRPARDQRWLMAYALNQFGGLQVLLHTAASQAAVISTDPVTPAAGLDAMNDAGVTHASATPTYWRFVLAHLRSPDTAVPALRQVTLGGEPVPDRLLEQLTETFPDAKITQIYGANEFGRNLSVRDRAAGVPVSALTQRGLELKVENGELWVRSEVGMLGYHGEEPIDPDAWRATGDLVEQVGDRIYFRGRASEVINVGGVKVHPFPVEERLSRIPGIQMSRVFGRSSALTGSIVAVEAVLEPEHDPEEIDRQIREACADLPPAARPRSIRFVDQIHTVQGKLARGAAPAEETTS